MGRTQLLVLGALCLAIHGWHFASGALTGQTGGIAELFNPDSPPGLATRPGLFFLFMAYYAALSVFGAVLIKRGLSAPKVAP